MNKPTQDPSLAYPQARPNDECESAKILVNEGLIDEAKKLLFRVLANHPNYAPAKKLLNEIGELELKEIFKLSSHASSRSAVEDVDQLIQSLVKKTGVGAVVVSHDLKSAFAISDRILLLEEGRPVFEGTPSAFRESTIPLAQSFLREWERYDN